MDVVGLLMGQSQDPYSYQNYYNEVNSPYLFYSYNPWLYMRQYSTGSAVPSTAYPTNVGTYNVSPNSYIKPPSFCVTWDNKKLTSTLYFLSIWVGHMLDLLKSLFLSSPSFVHLHKIAIQSEKSLSSQ